MAPQRPFLNGIKITLDLKIDCFVKLVQIRNICFKVVNTVTWIVIVGGGASQNYRINIADSYSIDFKQNIGLWICAGCTRGLPNLRPNCFVRDFKESDHDVLKYTYVLSCHASWQNGNI